MSKPFPALLGLALFACSALPPLITATPERIIWDHEPTVGTDDPTLADDTQSAVSSWRWGRYVLGCHRADICVTRGFLEPGQPFGRALWPAGGQQCTALINVHTWAIVTHEIGHCYGLGHSSDDRSVMYQYARPLWSQPGELGQWITFSDRDLLRSLQP